MPNWVYNNLTIKAKNEKRSMEVIKEITSEEDGNYRYMTDEELEEWGKRGELNG